METTIYNFNTSFYVPEIQKLAFHSTHVKILGTSHCGNSRQTAFKRRESFQDVLCRNDNSERAVDIFPHEIKSENYGGNRYVYIEGIVLEHFSASIPTEIN